MAIRSSVQVLAICCTLAVIGCNQAVEGDVDAANEENGVAAATPDDQAGTPAEDQDDAAVPAGGSSIPLSADNTTIEFLGTKDDGSHDGGFRELEGSLQLNGDAVQAIAVTAQTASLWADNPKLEGHLKNQDFFEVNAHPELKFVASRIEPATDGEGTHTIAGDLTMLGQTHPIEVPATIDVSAEKVHLVSNFTIDRTRWGMDYRPEQVHKDVQISVTIDAAR